MNKFKDLIGALRERGDGDEMLKKVISDLEALNALERNVPKDKSDQSFRLPYSSDPKPIEEAWN